MGRIAVVLSGLLLLGAVPARAAAWVCGIAESGTQLVCLADTDASASPPAPATAVVQGTAFPLDVRREWRVDFWNPGAEPEHLEQLARATICWRSPGCTVTLDGARWAGLVAAMGGRATALAKTAR